MLPKKIEFTKHKMLVLAPDECPHCHKGIDPIVLDVLPVSGGTKAPVVFVAYQCPVCEDVFWAKYFYLEEEYLTQRMMFTEIIGGEGLTKDFPLEIQEISPSFCKIYADAYKAQQAGLSEIVGIGYRRAFEFLMKDYAIYRNPNEKEKIYASSLSQVVTEYSPNEGTKEILLRATWLGNDFAHCSSKHGRMPL